MRSFSIIVLTTSILCSFIYTSAAHAAIDKIPNLYFEPLTLRSPMPSDYDDGPYMPGSLNSRSIESEISDHSTNTHSSPAFKEHGENADDLASKRPSRSPSPEQKKIESAYGQAENTVKETEGKRLKALGRLKQPQKSGLRSYSAERDHDKWYSKQIDAIIKLENVKADKSEHEDRKKQGSYEGELWQQHVLPKMSPEKHTAKQDEKEVTSGRGRPLSGEQGGRKGSGKKTATGNQPKTRSQTQRRGGPEKEAPKRRTRAWKSEEQRPAQRPKTRPRRNTL